MKSTFMKKAGIALLVITMLPTSLFAHSGRTDSRGGHKDNKNKSGLGSYHYHCGGYPAHLHKDGKCPYNGTSIPSSTSNNKTTSKPVAKPTYKNTTARFNINNNYIELQGIIDNEMTLVEMRPLCDALGIQIEWDSTSSTAYCSKGDTTFSLTVGSKSAQLNGSPIALERAPKLVNNKTLLPARFVAEAIGKVVNYDSTMGIITIE